ncbi:MAG: WD40 repeat domain-containing protein, partial [Gemmataceae bacterium]
MRWIAGLFITVAGMGVVPAQEGAQAAPFAAHQKAFETERAEAVAQSPTDPQLKLANATMTRALLAFKEGDVRLAERLARDARWQLPARPGQLPVYVKQVFGASRLRHADRVNALDYHPSGTQLASASRDGSVRIWDLGNGRDVRVYRGHTPPSAVTAENPTDEISVLRVGNVAWAPDGKSIASTGAKELHVWNPTTGAILQKFVGHTKMIRGLVWSADGKQIATCSDDKTVILWDRATGKALYTSVVQPMRLEAVAFASPGILVTVDSEGHLTSHVIESKKIVRIPVIPNANFGFTSVAVAPGGTKLLVGGIDRTAQYLAVPASDGALTPGALVKFVGHTDSVTGALTTPDGKLVVTASADKTIRVWEALTGKLLRLLPALNQPITALAVRPDGLQMASATDDGLLKLWDLTTVDEHTAVTDSKEPLWASAIHPDGQRIAAAGADRTIRISNRRGKTLASLSGHTAAVTSLVFLGPDKLASGSGESNIKIWDLKT